MSADGVASPTFEAKPLAIGPVRRHMAPWSNALAERRIALSDDAVFEAVIAGLGAAYGPFERVTTHAAVVLLDNDRALKLKRPVRYSFLNFTTLAARRRALENELRLNRRTAPDLYEGLVPVTRAGDGFALDGPGETVEWALQMRRFPDGARLDRVAEAGSLDKHLIERTAAKIAEFHESLPPLPDVDIAGEMAGVARGNAEDLRAAGPGVLPMDRVETLIAATEMALDGALPLMRARAEAGTVRHCHGDLHLANIALLDGEPVPFDCIEFDDAFAKIDVLYDLAFLLMDMVERGYHVKARAICQAWLDRTEDDAGLALLPLFLSLRAAVRAKIAAFSKDRDAAGRYLDLALLALEPRPPRLIAIGGRSGTGKTTLAKALAPDVGALPGAVLLRSDVIRKRLFGLEPWEQLPKSAYADAVSKRVFEHMADRALTLLRAGRAVVVDGVCGQPWERRAFKAAARRAGVPFIAFWLQAAGDVCLRRVMERVGDASDANAEVVMQQEAMDVGAVDWIKLDACSRREAIVAGARRWLEGG